VNLEQESIFDPQFYQLKKSGYKFFIDERMWAEDIENQFREPDGVTGWNSVLEV